MDVLEIMKKRRSIRFYSQEQIKKEELDKILEAGLWDLMPEVVKL